MVIPHPEIAIQYDETLISLYKMALCLKRSLILINYSSNEESLDSTNRKIFTDAKLKVVQMIILSFSEKKTVFSKTLHFRVFKVRIVW